MARKSRFKKTGRSKSAPRNDFISHYFRISLISITAGIAVFLIGSFLFKPSANCANTLSCQTDLVEKIENGETGVFFGRKFKAPIVDLAMDKIKSPVLGTNVPPSEKHIYVDLSSQKLYAFEGSAKILETFIASGRWGKTPTGNFNIWEKLRATRMSGGQGNDYYNLPNVPYVMYFYHDFGLHGAYWHDNFGHTMSHGCVNMRPVDAGLIFDWADAPANGQKGTAVSICDTFTEPDNCVQNSPI